MRLPLAPESRWIFRQSRPHLVWPLAGMAAISWAERILVMDQGRLAEEGDHDKRCTLSGLYATLCASQGRP